MKVRVHTGHHDPKQIELASPLAEALEKWINNMAARPMLQIFICPLCGSPRGHTLDCPMVVEAVRAGRDLEDA